MSYSFVLVRGEGNGIGYDEVGMNMIAEQAWKGRLEGRVADEGSGKIGLREGTV